MIKLNNTELDLFLLNSFSTRGTPTKVMQPITYIERETKWGWWDRFWGSKKMTTVTKMKTGSYEEYLRHVSLSSKRYSYEISELDLAPY